MYDVYIAEATIENDYHQFDTPEKKEAYIHEVFKKHHITQADWDTSLAWYSDNISIYLKINDSVKSRIQKEMQHIEKKLNSWREQEQEMRQRVFSESYIPTTHSFASGVFNNLRFRLDSGQIVERIPDSTFAFSFNVIGMPSDTLPILRSLLVLEYGDTTIYKTIAITENRNYHISASKYIDKDTIRELCGFVHLNRPVGNTHILLYNIALGADSIKHSATTVPEKISEIEMPRQLMKDEGEK